MHKYDSMKEKYFRKVSQTLDSPIMVFDYFELSEVMISLGALMLFGIVLYSWGLMFLSFFFTLGVLPVIRRKSRKGILFHWPYRHLKMSLPGIINPIGNKKFSD